MIVVLAAVQGAKDNAIFEDGWRRSYELCVEVHEQKAFECHIALTWL